MAHRVRSPRKRSDRHKAVDCAVSGLLLAVDLLLVVAILVLGSEGVFTEDWMGYPGMTDPAGETFQHSAVWFLITAEAVTVGLAVACRLWITAGTQLVALTAGSVFIGSLSTYWNP
ncbi:hypothetical protein [Streptomyces sp. S.PNR 29]|uniref:hypothetical protein n=1 Tax=Streptomyces sp. S.PNR 29 TaxID=2973805 RepID=UPI0025B1E1F5|nr:hypothetical protein [Streptomyces sp. S.PNR 29]MDN0197661.1 hypothetical protein [Streptomyces sp. S.PNR 29]